MWARITGTSAIVMALGFFTPGLARAQARTAPAVSVSTFAVTVPSFVRTVVDPSTSRASGAPIIRVITNDPAIRASLADGVPVERVRQEGDTDSVSGHSKGAEQVSTSESAVPVVRYTVVAP